MFLLFFILPAQADSFDDIHLQYGAVRVTEGTQSFSSAQETNRDTFVELNIGLAGLGYINRLEVAMPGASLLLGSTFSYSNVIFELQLGAALPSMVTGKIGIGFGNLNRNFVLAVRPWPLTVGPQVKIEQWTFSLEIGTGEGSSFQTGLIGTVGHRWMF